LDELGRYEEAIAAYDEALRLDPNDKDAYEKKGEALLALYPHIPARKADKESE
jgi:tetratricopeptide (TPR) repeat protein